MTQIIHKRTTPITTLPSIANHEKMSLATGCMCWHVFVMAMKWQYKYHFNHISAFLQLVRKSPCAFLWPFIWMWLWHVTELLAFNIQIKTNESIFAVIVTIIILSYYCLTWFVMASHHTWGVVTLMPGVIVVYCNTCSSITYSRDL